MVQIRIEGGVNEMDWGVRTVGATVLYRITTQNQQ